MSHSDARSAAIRDLYDLMQEVSNHTGLAILVTFRNPDTLEEVPPPAWTEIIGQRCLLCGEEH